MILKFIHWIPQIKHSRNSMRRLRAGQAEATTALPPFTLSPVVS